MERVTIEHAKQLFGDNFVGLDEQKSLFDKMGFSCDGIIVPEITYSLADLQEHSKDYILILGLPRVNNVFLSIQTFRECFGIDPDKSEPCLYNQDWYLHEDFIHSTLESCWYLLKKNILEDSRAVQPMELLKHNISFPSAILCVYTFFAYYYANGELLWYYDFVWCSDTDHNGDRIYVGKYYDVAGVNKNGFSIHRHLELRECYGSIQVI